MKMGPAPPRGTERGIYAASADYLDWRKTRAARGEGRTVKQHECRALAQSVFHPCQSVAQYHFLVRKQLSSQAGWG
jgi:alkylhydroperoxidase family enzyme